MAASQEQIYQIGRVLQDEKRPLKERFRALFTLRNLGGPTAIECIEKTFHDPSALLKHELAYCLGQMQDERANPVLMEVLKDVLQEPMVRHEAAEALGAIGSPASIGILQEYSQDPQIEVAETCQLAIERINSPKEELRKSTLYNSVDPAPPHEETNVKNLEKILLDEKETLFNRYKAMFALRNLQSDEAIQALGKGLRLGSALFRHEIAFVLGQIQSEASVEFLKESLENEQENEMVRHEAAEALGAIASEACTKILNKYLQDQKRVVKESCEIALDMSEYENSPEFQYANSLGC